jgi:hypothetical protein
MRKKGDIREDGMIFWRYRCSKKSYEQWVTPEDFNKNQNKFLDYRKHYYKTNKENIKSYLKKNKKRINISQAEYIKKRRKENNAIKLSNNIGNLIRDCFRKSKIIKSEATMEILGCSPSEFKSYIQENFSDGMTWENRNLWHIDHYFPVVYGKTKEQILALNHYTNLRPMWSSENIIKGCSRPSGPCTKNISFVYEINLPHTE